MEGKPKILKPVFYNPSWHYLDRSNGIWLSLQDQYLYALSAEGIFMSYNLTKAGTALHAKSQSAGTIIVNAIPREVHGGSYFELPNLSAKALIRRYTGLLGVNYYYRDGSYKILGYKEQDRSLILKLEGKNVSIKADQPKVLQLFWLHDPGLDDWLRDYIDWYVQTIWLDSTDWQDPRPCLQFVELFRSKLSKEMISRLYAKLVTQFNNDQAMAYSHQPEVIKIAWWLAHPEVASSILKGLPDATEDVTLSQQLRKFVAENSALSFADINLPWFNSSLAVENQNPLTHKQRLDSAGTLKRSQTKLLDRPPQSFGQILAYIWYNMKNR